MLSVSRLSFLLSLQYNLLWLRLDLDTEFRWWLEYYCFWRQRHVCIQLLS